MTEKLITVTKTAEKKITGDFVDISLNAWGEAAKYATATGKADRLADVTISALKAAGFSDISSLGVDVATVHDDGKIAGYRASRRFSVKFDYDKTAFGKALDILSESGCEWRISFTLKTPAAASAELLSEAVKAARAAAEIMAEAAGVKLGALHGITYGSENIGQPMVMCRATSFGSARDVQPNEIELSETVTCSWNIVG